MSALRVKIYRASEAVVVRLEGEAGIKAADALQAPLQRILGVRPSLVVFDLAELQFMASLFLGTLVNFRRGIAYYGGKVQLAALRPNILEVLQISRLLELFELVDVAPARPPVAVPEHPEQ
jgi:anti-anti-sigma factor